MTPRARRRGAGAVAARALPVARALCGACALLVAACAAGPVAAGPARAAVPAAAADAAMPAPIALAVPIVPQAPERCGQAALAMVLEFYGAPAESAGHAADAAYDRALRGSLVTDLAAAAHRAGHAARVATLAPDSLVALLAAGVPPIVLYQSGPGVVTLPHYAVVIGWDPARAVFTLADGGRRPRTLRRDDLARRWRTAGSQALIVERGAP